MSVGEDPRPGQSSTSKNDDHVERVGAVIRGNRCLTVREVAGKVGISTGSCHQVFTEKLPMHCVSAKFVPHLLTDDQKRTVLKSVMNCFPLQTGMNENFLKNIIKGDDTWVYGYDV
jgi:histone-lysine N-methyltransferase SETMAR